MPNNNSKKNKRSSPLTVNTSRNVGPNNKRGRERTRTRRRNNHSTRYNGNVPGTRNINNSTKKNYKQQLNNVRKATNKKTRNISKNPNSVGLRKWLLQRGQTANVNQRVAAEEEARRAEEERLAAAEKAEMAKEEELIKFNGPVPRSTSSSIFN